MADQQLSRGSKKDAYTKGPEFILQRKVEDMMDYGLDAVAQYPKNVKYTVGDHVIEIMNDIADKTIEVKKKFTKKTTLQNLDIKIDQLRYFIRLSYRRRYISVGRYDVWSGQVDEIGRIVGGMMNNETSKYSNPGE